jgi:hypothetical protein
LSRADTRRTKGKAYVTPGSIQGRVPRLSPGNDPCRHRATSNPNGVGNLHVQLRCMRSYHIQSRRNAVGRTSAKPSKQGPPPSLIGPEWRPVPPSESPGRAGSRLAYTDALSSCGGISTPGRERAHGRPRAAALPAGWHEPRTRNRKPAGRLFVLKRAIDGLDRRLDGHETGPHVCLASFVRLGECLGQLAAFGDELLFHRSELFRMLFSHFR